MTFAEDQTYQYIRRYHSKFCSIHVLEILPYLYCLTTGDQDRLRASFHGWGNQDTLWELFNSLQRRNGWVDCFIQALRTCEKTDLADEVASVYRSHLLSSTEPASVRARVPGPSSASVPPSAAHNGYREEELRRSIPVQDSQSDFQGEVSGAVGEDSNIASRTSSSSGTVSRESSNSQEPSFDMAARRPRPSSGHQDQDTEPSNTHTADVPSSLVPPRGPVSPTVSFQPLSRAHPRASRLPGPSVSYAGPGISSPPAGPASVGGAGDQAKAAVCSSGPGMSTNSMTTTTVSSKGPANPAFASTVPSKLPINSSATSSVPSKGAASTKPPGAMTSTVPTSLATSKLPINSARAGTVPPKVPPSSVPTGTVPTIKSSQRPTEETPASQVPTGAVTGGSLPHPDRSASSKSLELELSKPGELVSHLDSSFSTSSGDLAISYSSSFGPACGNTPEENEYQTVDSIRVHVEENPSADLLAGSPEQQGALKLQKLQKESQKEFKGRGASWAPWFTAATLGALLVGVLAVLYRRRLLQ